MQVRIGLNVLAQTVTDRDGLLNRIVASTWPALIMDEPAIALGLRGRAAAGQQIVHRAWREDDGELYRRMTPAQFVDSVAGFANTGVIVQCHNEPRIDAGSVGAFVGWTVAAMRLARARGIRLYVGTFATGNPHESLIVAGLFDPLLLELRDGFHVLMLHEYFFVDPLDAAEAGWLIGRVEYWLERAAQIGAPLRSVCMGEYGRDRGGGPNDGWRDQGWTAAEYARRMVRGWEVYEQLARQYRCAFDVLIFCAGAGGNGRWRSFDVQGAPEVFVAMDAFNAQAAAPDVPRPEDLGRVLSGRVAALRQNVANVRRAPTDAADVIAQVRVGDAVRWRETMVGPYGVRGSYLWYYLESHGGWLADVATLDTTPADTPLVSLPVPYRSQIGAGASAYANDCGAACANMAFQYALEQAGLGQARGVTVDDMARDSALVGNGDRGLTPSQVVTLLAAYGVRAEARRAVTPEALVQEIDARRPIICLVAYKHIRPQDAFDGGHYVVVKGYGRYGFYVHDPYNGGADYYVSRAALVEAMRDVSPFASIPNQAVVLTPAPK